MQEKWDARFLTLADSIATWSKDPSRGVGAVIVSPVRQVIATGYNGLPRGFADHEERLQRPVKYDLLATVFRQSMEQSIQRLAHVSTVHYLLCKQASREW